MEEDEVMDDEVVTPPMDAAVVEPGASSMVVPVPS